MFGSISSFEKGVSGYAFFFIVGWPFGRPFLTRLFRPIFFAGAFSLKFGWAFGVFARAFVAWLFFARPFVVLAGPLAFIAKRVFLRPLGFLLFVFGRPFGEFQASDGAAAEVHVQLL